MLDGLPPVLFALISAFLFAVAAQLQNLGLAYADSRAGTAISIGATALFFWLLAPFLMDPAHWYQPAVLIFLLLGLIRPALSANLAMAGTRYLGPTLTSTLAAISPLFGAAFGVFWLGEALTWPVAAGTVGIIAAVALLARRGRFDTVNWPVWALLLPVGAALIRAFGHALSKVGMEQIPDPYFAALAAFTVSGVITVIIHRARPGSPRIPWHTRGPVWFAASGIVAGISLISLNVGLMHGDVVTIVPVVAASPIFTLLLSAALFRRERITGRVVAAVFLVVPAVMLIAVSR